MACDLLAGISRGLRTFKDFESSKFDFWTSDLLVSRAFSSVIISSFLSRAVHSSEATLLQFVSVVEVDDHVEFVAVFVCCDTEAVIGWLEE